MKMILTNAGRQALVNSEQNGTANVVIKTIGVGTGKYTPTATQTALVGETKRLNITEGMSTTAHTIHVAYIDQSSDSYTVNEIGLFLEDGTLFAVTSQTAAIVTKNATAAVQLVIDVAFNDVDVSNVTFGDVTFSNPEATTDNAGVVVLATETDVTTGTNTQKAITPKALLARTSTVDRIGLVELATNTEALAGTDTTRAVTPAGMKATIDARAATNDQTIAGTVANVFVTPESLKALTATTARKGLIEIATAAEMTTGTDTTRAVTPALVMSAIEASKSDATTSAKGLVELATIAEVQAGTSSTLAVTPAGLKNYFRGIEINESADIVSTGGKGQMSLYPSGQSDYVQARAGTSQMAIARFSDDAPGASLVLFKSRGGTVKTTKSVLPGDQIGMINFMCDNGRVSYDGTTIGARVAYINAEVFESSTITSSGTTNLGIRGALRFYVCSDAASRDGTGFELLDNTIRPLADDTLGLGTSGRRFKTIYAINGTVQTSDERQKKDIKPIEEKVLDAWKRVNFAQFRFMNDDKKIHFGVIAQRVQEAFDAEGLDAHDFGLFCEERDDSGETILGIRYAEALALECALMRREMEVLKNGNC